MNFAIERFFEQKHLEVTGTVTELFQRLSDQIEFENSEAFSPKRRSVIVDSNSDSDRYVSDTNEGHD